jgi:lipopolysaccharide/colanic/teichoic acid biosynthesis glycosyltransferase
MRLKQAFDFIIALVGLVLLIPIYITISILIYFRMGSPVLYIQERIGQHGKPFSIIKFRTMIQNAEALEGGSITTVKDLRITPMGQYLRKWKLDELPTLFNVLRGDMSMVGPRPDVSEYYDRLTESELKIFDLKPGITGPASLSYANEEQLLSSVQNPIQYYNDIIFPDKVKINLSYYHTHSLWSDLKIIFQTLFRTNY